MVMIETGLNQFLQCQASDVALRAGALSFFFQNLNTEALDESGGEKNQGIGLLLQDIESRSRRIADLLDSAHLLEAEETFEVDWSEADPISRVESYMEEKRLAKPRGRLAAS
jgi:hypothetical protein